MSKSKKLWSFFVIYILDFWLREEKNEAKEIFKIYWEEKINLDGEKNRPDPESGSPGPPTVNCKTG